MSVYLGNLNVNDIQKRAGVEFPKELVEYMEPRQQALASNIKEGFWHCFDIPFVLMCGDRDTAEEIYKYLVPLSKSFKEELQISLNPKTN